MGWLAAGASGGRPGTQLCGFFAGSPGGHRGEGGLREELTAGRYRWGAPQVSNLWRPHPQLCPPATLNLAPTMWWTFFRGQRCQVKKT